MRIACNMPVCSYTANSGSACGQGFDLAVLLGDAIPDARTEHTALGHCSCL